MVSLKQLRDREISVAIPVDFEDDEDHAITIWCHPLDPKYEKAWDAIAKEVASIQDMVKGDAKQMERAARQILTVAIRWDVQDGKKDAPLNVKNLCSLGLALLNEMRNAIQEALVGIDPMVAIQALLAQNQDRKPPARLSVVKKTGTPPEKASPEES